MVVCSVEKYSTLTHFCFIHGEVTSSKSLLLLLVGMHDQIFYFEMFKKFVEILEYFKTPSLKYFMKFF